MGNQNNPQSEVASNDSSRREVLRSFPPAAVGITAGLAGCVGGDDTTTLRLSGCHPKDGSNMGEFQQTFAENVEEMSDGSLMIENYYDGELGGTIEVIESTINGSVDMNACHHYPGTADVLGLPKLAFFSSPFVYENYEDALTATDPEESDFANEMYEKQLEGGVRVLTSLAFGTRCFSMSEEEATNPDEVGGARIRGPSGELMETVISGLGGDPVLIDWSETPQALATGMADGVEQITWALEQEPILENINYLIETNHMSEVIGLSINEDRFQGLSDNHKEILQEAAIETRDEELPKAQERDAGRIDNIADSGVEVINEESGLDRGSFVDSVHEEMIDTFPEWEETRERLMEPL